MEENKVIDAQIEVIEYSLDECKEFHIDGTDMQQVHCLSNVPGDHIRWINVDNEITLELLGKINSEFGIHHLITEDIRNNKHRAMIEDYREYLHIAAKMIFYRGDELVVEHMNFIMGKDYVISYGETEGDIFDELRERIRSHGARIRSLGADYLMYAILDAVIDGYFNVLDKISERIETIEDNVTDSSQKQWFDEIRQVKNTLLRIQRYFWPLREVLSKLGKESYELIQLSTQPYLRDIHEHIIQVIETTEMHRELLSGLTEVYISNTSNRLNEIMKVLTIISTIFIPLSFIVGLYGMNFKYMPELQYRWGYPIVCMLLACIILFMLLFFKKKKWF